MFLAIGPGVACGLSAILGEVTQRKIFVHSPILKYGELAKMSAYFNGRCTRCISCKGLWTIRTQYASGNVIMPTCFCLFLVYFLWRALLMVVFDGSSDARNVVKGHYSCQ